MTRSARPMAVRVAGLSKSYLVAPTARHANLRDLLSGRWPAPPAGSPNGSEDGRFWALRDLTFELEPGDTLGVIGSNGAGKSTLLHILARVTRPTEGYAEVAGRVGALLDVGTGFNTELSGRENVYLSGAILGMRRREIGARFDEIIAFAEVEEFVDTPVKHYSHGMGARLAFAIAVHLDTDILLVDDVFAVGDATFRDRFRAKIADITRRDGTIILVSHDMDAVNALCRRTLLIERGHLVHLGDTAETTRLHLSRRTPSPTPR